MYNPYDFNPRTSCEVRLSGLCGTTETVYNFNPRTSCEVRQQLKQRQLFAERLFQSTHPMRGATGMENGYILQEYLFQSTHPMRGATMIIMSPRRITIYFNPRTPCGVRHGSQAKSRGSVISIHAPHAGCDSQQHD